MIYDLIIIGSGAAGLSAALYAGRYKMKSLVIGGEFGGETATAGTIENYPGVVSVDGYDLMKTMRAQAESLGVEIFEEWASTVQKHEEKFRVATKEENVYEGRTVIFALGSKRRHLNLPHEKELVGKGVHYCWTCDGPLYGGKTVVMVGGGDSSVKGVNFLGEYAEKIYLVTREKSLKAEPVNLEHMKRLGTKVEVILETDVKEIVGTSMLEKIMLSKDFRGSPELRVDGLFIEIGFDPDTELSKSLGLVLDDKHFIRVDNMMRTNIPGAFAAGDSTTHFGSFKQDITAAALGAVAATSAYEYAQSLT